MKSEPIHSKITQYGFEYGNAKVIRLHSDKTSGWVMLGIETDKYSCNAGLQVYITKTGKVRIFDIKGEWSKPTPYGGRIKHRKKVVDT